MIVVLSIVAGLAAAFIAYRVLFYDSGDFWDGFVRFATCFLYRRSSWIWQRNSQQPRPENFEDDSWSSGIRFGIFVLLAVGSGVLLYHELVAHFRG